MVREATKKLRNGREKQILMNACKNENMPRKRKPFINFLKNSGKCRDDDIAEKVWNSLQLCLEWVKKAEQKAKETEVTQDKCEVTTEASS